MRYIVVVFFAIISAACEKIVPPEVLGTYSGTLEYSYVGDSTIFVDTSFILTITDKGVKDDRLVDINSSHFYLGEFSCNQAHMWRSYVFVSTTTPSFSEYMRKRSNSLQWNDTLPDGSIYFDFDVKKN